MLIICMMGWKCIQLDTAECVVRGNVFRNEILFQILQNLAVMFICLHVVSICKPVIQACKISRCEYISSCSLAGLSISHTQCCSVSKYQIYQLVLYWWMYYRLVHAAAYALGRHCVQSPGSSTFLCEMENLTRSINAFYTEFTWRTILPNSIQIRFEMTEMWDFLKRSAQQEEWEQDEQRYKMIQKCKWLAITDDSGIFVIWQLYYSLILFHIIQDTIKVSTEYGLLSDWEDFPTVSVVTLNLPIINEPFHG